MKVKSTPWRKPIGDCGGINTLIERHYNTLHAKDSFCYFDVITHAYREVGTSLEASIEVQYWTLHKKKRKITHISFETFYV